MFKKLHFVFLLLCLLQSKKFTFGKTEDSSDLPDPSQFIVWGPGLDNRVVLPVYYFFVQMVDSQGNNITSSLGPDVIKLSMESKHYSHLRISMQVLDRHDGVYIIRYKLFQTYKDLKLKLTFRDQPISTFPHLLKGCCYNEDCYCPKKSLARWLGTLNCPKSYDQIDKDFKAFRRINMTRMYKRMMVEFNKPYQMSVIHYVVKDNKLYRETLGEYVGFKMFSDAMLMSLMRKVKLPDLDFFWNLGDWPLVRRTSAHRYPMVSWCGSDDTFDFVVPSYEMTTSTLDAMYRVEKDMLSMEHYRNIDWSSKTDLAFWRGRDSSRERLKLVRLSQKQKDVVDAELTHIFFFRDEKDLKTVNSTPFFDFFKHKYQINMDGTVAAYRLSYLLAGGSLVFKQQSSYYEHFYNLLQPFVHYVPLSSDIEDLMERLQWAKDHDDEVRDFPILLWIVGI
ncbi:hypothetical protein HELRODRAFT_114917 [Helobdella robusta]|uniref:Glycosyl transferase CAP10 domain-containing protein n=1 Tax=Helobdella robusta TaxID=6412 RepID=T1EG54_HELRO|nr:hypothetical protein HELRODRAFT_114917 [Helobdella robusta]ESN94970.1 hypothetical protein HELRODRAFT_114917 [Helobdella robusta]